MAYSTEVVSRARARLAQAKTDRELENRDHLLRAYEQVPRLREIDRQLRLTMARAAKAVFAGGDARELMEKAKQENLQLQHERQWIIDTTFEEGYLDEGPICDQCGGNGYVGSTMCECLRELCRQEQKKELTVLTAGRENFDQFRLDYYSDQADSHMGISPRKVMEKTFTTCRRYAFTFSEKSGSMLFSGNTGLGKTFLSACIARSVAEAGYSVVYESAGKMFAALERAHFESSDETRAAVEKYYACDLLIVDDLGAEMTTQFVTTALYALVNERLLTAKPTIISTNLEEEELSRRYSPAVASRLRGSYKRIAFMGEDIRVKYKKEK